MESVNVSMRLINFAIEQNTLVMKMHASILRKYTRFPSKWLLLFFVVVVAYSFTLFTFNGNHLVF